ncbi:MAG: hypothetical protein HRU41_05950 [Saprospiraceae bacterium]|nr:hypothetical protein [Saprospiraceae bacterium]
MIDILFFTDFEEGHFLPTLKTAQNLEAAGYKIAFVGITDVMTKVSSYGFDTYPIFADLYPQGFVKQVKQKRAQQVVVKEQHYERLLQGELDPLIDRLQPKLLVVSFFIPIDNLILHYRYGIPQVVFQTYLPGPHELPDLSGSQLANFAAQFCLRQIMRLTGIFPNTMLSFLLKKGIQITQLDDVVAPIRAMPQLMPCPQAFDFNMNDQDERSIYLGPCIRKRDGVHQDISIFLPDDPSKKIIYMAMGSQISAYPVKAQRVFQQAINAMHDPRLSDYHMIIAGGSFREEQFQNIPNNVGIFSWVPQIEILQRAEVAIIHGGLGSVKECIFQAVPMIVIPMGRDQFSNAERVVLHQLGKQCKLETISAIGLVDAVIELQNNTELQQCVDGMKSVFHNLDDQELDLQFFRQYLMKVQQLIH